MNEISKVSDEAIVGLPATECEHSEPITIRYISGDYEEVMAARHREEEEHRQRVMSAESRVALAAAEAAEEKNRVLEDAKDMSNEELTERHTRSKSIPERTAIYEVLLSRKKSVML